MFNFNFDWLVIAAAPTDEHIATTNIVAVHLTKLALIIYMQLPSYQYFIIFMYKSS